MRKGLTIFLVGLLFFASFGPAAQAKVLKVAGLDGGWGREHWDELAARFEAANPGITIELTLAQNIAEVLRPQIIARNYPDLIYFDLQRAGQTKIRGLVRLERQCFSGSDGGLRT